MLLSFGVFVQIAIIFLSAYSGVEYETYNYLNILCKQINSLNESGSGISIQFVINWIFLGYALFLNTVTVKGNDVYGYRQACFTFYAMT
jgi:hypothetical protein